MPELCYWRIVKLVDLLAEFQVAVDFRLDKEVEVVLLSGEQIVDMLAVHRLVGVVGLARRGISVVVVQIYYFLDFVVAVYNRTTSRVRLDSIDAL